MFITIGLIVLVAALNIVATLIMMVLEKTRDIAILLSMGATSEKIRRIFILQGVIIGVDRHRLRRRSRPGHLLLRRQVPSDQPGGGRVHHRVRSVQGRAPRLGHRCGFGDSDQLSGHALSLGRRVEAAAGGSAAV